MAHEIAFGTAIHQCILNSPTPFWRAAPILGQDCCSKRRPLTTARALRRARGRVLYFLCLLWFCYNARKPVPICKAIFDQSRPTTSFGIGHQPFRSNFISRNVFLDQWATHLLPGFCSNTTMTDIKKTKDMWLALRSKGPGQTKIVWWPAGRVGPLQKL